MTIHFHCECGQKLKASSDSIGKSFDCPVCGSSVTVPVEDEAGALAANGAIHAAQVGAPSANNKQQGNSRPNGDTKPFAGPSGQTGLKESDTKEFATGDTKEFAAPHDPMPEKPRKKPASAPRVEKEIRESLDVESRQAIDTGYERLNPIYERVHVATSHHEGPTHDERLGKHDESSADTARDLYRLVRKMKKDGKAQAVAKPKKKRTASGDEGTDYGALLVELGRSVLPAVAGIILVSALAYWLSSTVMSSGRGLPELGDVEGTITLDGAPLAGATVTFIPVPEDDETSSRVSSSVGITDASGYYELKYVQDVDGAAVGAHQVMINLPLPNGAEKLPRRYNSATELSFVVESGNNTANFDLTTK